MSEDELLAGLEGRIGDTLYTSPWLAIDQARINAFAEATGDFQWIHTEPDRAARESPYGATIAHGFLILSLYPFLRNLFDEAQPAYAGVRSAINYGLNRVRFPNAVLAGAQVRGRFGLVAAARASGGVQVTESCTIEIEDQEKPACVAEAVLRLYL